MKILSNLFNFLIQGIKNNTTLSTVKSDFSEAFNSELTLLWKSVRPIFIKEDPDLVNALEKTPDDEVAQAGFKYQLSKLLKNEEFATLVKPHLEALEKSNKAQKVNKVNVKGTGNTTIVDVKNSGTIKISNNDRK